MYVYTIRNKKIKISKQPWDIFQQNQKKNGKNKLKRVYSYTSGSMAYWQNHFLKVLNMVIH